MMQRRMYLQNFTYLVVGHIETSSCTKGTKSAVIRHKMQEIIQSKVKC